LSNIYSNLQLMTWEQSWKP